MEIGVIRKKVKDNIAKFKFVAIVLIAGIVLMLIPGFDKSEETIQPDVSAENRVSIEEELAKLLSKVHGAGRVEVLLNIEQGEQTIYQVDADISISDSGNSDRTQTVTLTDAQRNQYGLVQQVNPPVYLGAVVLCQGANDPVVKLSIVEAVSKITGLNANKICVLKMD